MVHTVVYTPTCITCLPLKLTILLHHHGVSILVQSSWKNHVMTSYMIDGSRLSTNSGSTMELPLVTSGVPRSRSRHTKFSDRRLRCTRSQQLFSVAQFGMCCPPTVLGRKAAFETPKWNGYLQVRWNQLHATTMQMTRGKVSKNPCHSSIQSFDLDT